MAPKSPSTNLNRSELLQNVNRFLKTNYSLMSDFSDGVAFAQILHACMPDHVPLHKINFHVRNKLQALKNLSIVDEALKNSGLFKTCPKHKIATRSSLESYHFLKWCWIYLNNHHSHVLDTYRAEECRNAFQQKIQQERKDLSDLSFNSVEYNRDSETGRLCNKLEDDIISRLSALKSSLQELDRQRLYTSVLKQELGKLQAACESQSPHPVALKLLACIKSQNPDTRIIPFIG